MPIEVDVAEDRSAPSSIPKWSNCYYCHKKDSCQYAGDPDRCVINIITDAKWIVGTDAFKTAYHGLKSLNEAACDPHLSASIKQLQAVVDLSCKPLPEWLQGT